MRAFRWFTRAVHTGLMGVAALTFLVEAAAPTGLRVELIKDPDVVNPDTKIYSQRGENRRTTVAVEDPNPEFSWIVPASSRNVFQSAYQILVATSLTNANGGNGDAWNSGVVLSDHSVAVSLAGGPLRPNTDYYWKVKVQTNEGWSDYSAVQHFKTGTFAAPYATTRSPIVETPVNATSIQKTGASEWYYDFSGASFGQAMIHIPSLANSR